MRKINLENYLVKNKNEDLPYYVKDSIIGALFNPDLKLNGRDLLLQNKLANKIEEAEEEILLEESDYLKVKMAFEILTGYTRNDVELVERILNTEEIEVKEK